MRPTCIRNIFLPFNRSLFRPALTSQTNSFESQKASKQNANERNKRKIMNMHCHNKSIVEIARTWDRSTKIVWSFVQAPDRYEKAKKVKNRAKCQPLTRGFCCVKLKKKQSTQQLCQKLEVPTIKNCVQQIKCEAHVPKKKNFKKAPSLIAAHKKHRFYVTKAVLRANAQCHKKGFYDEKMYNRHDPVSLEFYW